MAVEREPKQLWMAGAGAKKFRWWSQSLKLGFSFNRNSVWV